MAFSKVIKWHVTVKGCLFIWQKQSPSPSKTSEGRTWGPPGKSNERTSGLSGLGNYARGAYYYFVVIWLLDSLKQAVLPNLPWDALISSGQRTFSWWVTGLRQLQTASKGARLLGSFWNCYFPESPGPASLWERGHGWREIYVRASYLELLVWSPWKLKERRLESSVVQEEQSKWWSRICFRGAVYHCSLLSFKEPRDDGQVGENWDDGRKWSGSTGNKGETSLQNSSAPSENSASCVIII